MNLSDFTDTLIVNVARREQHTAAIAVFELRAPDDGTLPPFTAGAHIELFLRHGLSRCYSLLNDPAERHRYVIGVNRDAASRGGSAFVHEHLREGATLKIGTPRNHFPLDEAAAGVGHTVLVAGGIGVTPLLSMAARLEALRRPWTLHYCARNRESAAFVDRLEGGDFSYGRVEWHFDHAPGQGALDLGRLVDEAPAGTHLYCCGPAPMLKAFEAQVARRADCHGHVEYFGGAGAPEGSAGQYEVVLARSDRIVVVRPGQTMLDALLDAGVDAPYSCREGVCGTCEVAVLEGTPEHRDLVLSQDERAGGRTVMICCSGCKGDRLVLDL
ncbi:PDR/VanB family oxidoreductase [Pandoraea pulmonicola]|uniref:Phthalate dioxygenase reductase n=1 Tax=Pandoraea pulmonicola TaxID=93221 RepID=A0AAJ4ZDQ2_PANPU|nr:PDR/VanB family oxidoreductase [Pandoraea pulmonicola]SUA91532.1 Phthalate dioxygenase reductase [Pandoraea pulmonicola]